MASPDYHVGALFEALDEGVLMTPSKSIGYFLPFQVALKCGALGATPHMSIVCHDVPEASFGT